MINLYPIFPVSHLAPPAKKHKVQPGTSLQLWGSNNFSVRLLYALRNNVTHVLHADLSALKSGNIASKTLVLSEEEVTGTSVPGEVIRSS